MSELLIIITVIACAILYSPAEATIYYVDKNNPNANDENSGTSAMLPWSSIAKANAALVAGDTVYIKGGTYIAGTRNYIAPVSSGTEGKRITYSNFQNEVVTVTDGAYAINLNGNDYITVHGFRFTNLDRFMYLRNDADFNVIDGNLFDQMRNYATWAGSRIYQNSDHNILRNNTFLGYGVCAGGSDDGSVLDIGAEEAGGDASDYNLLENNVFARGGHHVTGVFSRFNVIRNNYLYNDAWANGKGNRTLYMAGQSGYSGSNLIENNRMGYAAVPCDAEGVAGMLLANSTNIVRYNSFYHNNLNGLSIQVYDTNASLNVIYNNTFFNNAYDPNRSAYGANEFGAITLGKWNPPEVKFNKIINNLFYSHAFDGNQPIGQNGAFRSDQFIVNNYDGDVSGNPLFVSASVIPPFDKSDVRFPDLHLQLQSPAIDIGVRLTTVVSGCGSSTPQIVLADASYFQDGTWGIAGQVQADWIAVGTVTNARQVASISGNVVNLVSAISCENGNHVWLYKDSDGTQVLFGSAPDVGSYEFSTKDPSPPAPPSGLRVVN